MTRGLDRPDGWAVWYNGVNKSCCYVFRTREAACWWRDEVVEHADVLPVLLPLGEVVTWKSVGQAPHFEWLAEETRSLSPDPVRPYLIAALRSK